MSHRILVVDDEVACLRSLSAVLTQNGYDVKAVSNGEKAIRCLSGQYELLILEIHLPGISGFEVFKQAASLCSDTKAIFLTAYPSVETAIDAIHLKANDYLRKPVSTEMILSSVKQAFDEPKLKNPVEKVTSIKDPTANYFPYGDRSGIHINLHGSKSAIPGIIVLSKGGSIDLNRRVIEHGGKAVKLTPTENRLLRVFLENEGELLAHRRLVMMAQGYNTSELEAPFVLRPLVSRLRHKLLGVPGLNLKIINIRGTGYIVECKENYAVK